MTSIQAVPAPDATEDQVPIVQLAAVRAGYGRIDVLHGIDLELRAGEVFALLGPNGAGKSTTLAVCSGQIVPSTGGIFLCGRDVTGVAPDALARTGVCLIPEGRGIFPNLTVLENLRMATFTGRSFSDVLELAFAQFPRLGERRKQTAGTMSGGEQQMLSMARALATEPAVLLIDELSMGLAPIIVEELYDHVRRIAASGLSILIVEQFAHEILGLADRAGIMLHGRLLHTGPPASIAGELADAYLGAEHVAPAAHPSQ
ncbi:MAG: branched-chain amino acid transport system ATP-binding protein [Actinomycetota bacterium]|jgi:branched-chain amino acid transport system ATP-binding protein|nr:branched-chain amino acid transport system ATP-binding protein [Actinomycetota bacterium]